MKASGVSINPSPRHSSSRFTHGARNAPSSAVSIEDVILGTMYCDGGGVKAYNVLHPGESSEP